MSYMPKSKNQEHLTPDRVYDIIEKHWGIIKESLYDPVPEGTPYKSPCFFNGLYGDWKSINYVNPPFEVKTLRKFYQKALEQRMKGKFTIMLLPSKTDQDWFHDIIYNNFSIKWIKKRLKFKNDKDSSMGGHFLVLIA